jgi:hypothetical protein
MIASSRVSAPEPPAQKGRWGWKGAMSWDLMRRDALELKVLLQGRRTRFLDEMLRMVCFYTYFGALLQDKEIRGYLMENHPETLKKIEHTLGYLRQHAQGSQLDPIPMWTIAKAAKDLPGLIAKARSEQPQVVGHNGQPRVVVVAANRWDLILRRYPDVAQLAQPMRKFSPATTQSVRSRSAAKPSIPAVKRKAKTRRVRDQIADGAAVPARGRALPLRRRA